ncbi:MAG: NAD(+) synthase [Clostridia bacterium]|nr:NAD(+) synthase [Clostridia bacterium]
MKHGFLKVACALPKIKIADASYNADEIINIAKEAHSQGVKVLVFPELCISAYTCGDLIFSPVLLDASLNALKAYVTKTKSFDMLSVVGLPILHKNKIYNCAAVVKGGELLGLIPKSELLSYGEFCEGRYFAPYPQENSVYTFEGKELPFGKDILFSCTTMPTLKLGIEIGDAATGNDLGATVIANLSASPEVVTKDAFRKTLVSYQSAKTASAYLYANCGEGESTTDLVFSGHSLIAENGTILAEREPFDFGSKLLITDIDLERISCERRRKNTVSNNSNKNIITVNFDFSIENTKISRFISPYPFVPIDEKELSARIKTIRDIQAYGLKQRIEASGAKKCIIGISGGLDSSLALLSTVYAFDIMGKDRKNIIAVTMPCFGTTKRTRSNSEILSTELGVDFREIDISDAVKVHLENIGHDLSCHNVVYENAQARERTQVLMDVANAEGALVIGTGDLSELCLGWATYNGDHMSMYALNSDIPKTLIRLIVAFYADECKSLGEIKLYDVLCDILATPVSPELLPADNGSIVQKTEDLVGPYEIHDFYLFYTLKFNFAPDKLFRIAQIAFEGKYDNATLLKWLRVFVRRFFSQQFKRSCLPDGPKVGSVGVSPRGDLRMPSDATCAEWLKLIDEIKI